jgi:hypothetical protein
MGSTFPAEALFAAVLRGLAAAFGAALAFLTVFAMWQFSYANSANEQALILRIPKSDRPSRVKRC